ncbi:MAG: hypothetical protein ACLGIJ_12005 [Candidatus Limnocylindria bacterium]
MSERDVSEEQIRGEHLAEVVQARQAAYLIAVLGGGLLLMLGLIAVLGATA